MDKELFKKTARYCIAVSDCSDCCDCRLVGDIDIEMGCIDILLSEAINIIESLERELNDAKNKADDIILPSGADKAEANKLLERFSDFYKAQSYSDVWDFERAIKQFKIKEHLND